LELALQGLSQLIHDQLFVLDPTFLPNWAHACKRRRGDFTLPQVNNVVRSLQLLKLAPLYLGPEYLGLADLCFGDTVIFLDEASRFDEEGVLYGVQARLSQLLEDAGYRVVRVDVRDLDTTEMDHLKNRIRDENQ
jgi:hypothetical protein